MKPGPPRECDCGHCRLCKGRNRRDRFYRKNAPRLIQLSAEYRRRRKDRAKGVS